MANEQFQANWRGARRYQFDEEARRKAGALADAEPETVRMGPWNLTTVPDNLHKVLPVKYLEPEKLKVIVEDLQRDKLTTAFKLAAVLAFAITFVAVYLL